MERRNVVRLHEKVKKKILKKLWTCFFTSDLWKIFWAFFIQKPIWIFYWKRFNLSKPIWVIWINPLISITHEICQSLGVGLDVRRVFLDISKAFDKVWHEGLIYNIKQNGVKSNLLDTQFTRLNFLLGNKEWF